MFGSRLRRRTRLLSAAAAVLAAGAVAVPPALANEGESEPTASQLAKVRAATAKYHNLDVALADGYVPVSPCVESPMGTMGIHYLKPQLLDDIVDPVQPELLLYIPNEDGAPRLVAVEYMVPDADGDTVTDEDRPHILGLPFHGPMEGHGPGTPVHYDRHVWIWSHNPAGMFEDWNPALSCPEGAAH